MGNAANDRNGGVMARHADVTLSVLIAGKAVSPPVKFAFAELQQRMVVDFLCDASRIRAIFKMVEDHGACRLSGRNPSEVYLIQKILSS
jgi:hypothetical protein